MKLILLGLTLIVVNGCTTVAENFVRNCDGKITHNCIEKKEQIENYKNSVDVRYWQSYSYGFYNHQWNESDAELEIIDLGRLGEDFNAPYGYIRNDKIVVENRGGPRETFRIDKNSTLTKYFVYNEDKKIRYENDGYTFFAKDDNIYACKIENSYDCKSIDIVADSFPYLFGSKGSNSIIGTNYGEVIGFINNEFCRMDKKDNDWECSENAKLVTPRGFQLYSFISMDDENNLIGSWPNGALYSFDGKKLNQIYRLPFESNNYEAQSMVFYCGDIYIGYWPRGELFKFDKKRQILTLVKRFFSESEFDLNNIPYAGRSGDGDNSAKYGQRITSIVPYGDSMLLFTSSLHSAWGRLNSEQLNSKKLEEYGKVYRLRKPQCMSTY